MPVLLDKSVPPDFDPLVVIEIRECHQGEPDRMAI